MMTEAPIEIGGMRVMRWSHIDHRHRPTGGCRHVVSGVVMGTPAGVAICQDGSSFYLFYCDASWNPLTCGLPCSRIPNSQGT
jgi:hypothetical protein